MNLPYQPFRVFLKFSPRTFNGLTEAHRASQLDRGKHGTIASQTPELRKSPSALDEKFSVTQPSNRDFPSEWADRVDQQNGMFVQHLFEDSLSAENCSTRGKQFRPWFPGIHKQNQTQSFRSACCVCVPACTSPHAASDTTPTTSKLSYRFSVSTSTVELGI
jgi:hypothetical protein